ncbi:hypothetical protein KZZ52_35070 [Dactylosporangium sp. AC04546]|uniref:hypothetical protein n=1 Tax=Dactylosporangium sp. AC04546 TaxID=2862460 RepID=UPI001EDCD89D|nr:hypothetical protein [Dactylosporangium sp. AC04546]WVK79193.1 hypothetical protein KZZ52_35070 [Dactylosporangium sp. AC04546]
MKNASALRSAAVGLALTMCALLLGLSHAHHALPGDTFQVARTASAAAAVVAPGTEALKPPVKPSDGQVWHTTLPEVVALDPRQALTAATHADQIVHRGRCVGTPGCRGPPISS